MAEWSIAPVLKTGNGQPFVSSNLTASAKKFGFWEFSGFIKQPPRHRCCLVRGGRGSWPMAGGAMLGTVNPCEWLRQGGVGRYNLIFDRQQVAARWKERLSGFAGMACDRQATRGGMESSVGRRSGQSCNTTRCRAFGLAQQRGRLHRPFFLLAAKTCCAN